MQIMPDQQMHQIQLHHPLPQHYSQALPLEIQVLILYQTTRLEDLI